jgi:hypothetical protein
MFFTKEIGACITFELVPSVIKSMNPLTTLSIISVTSSTIVFVSSPLLSPLSVFVFHRYHLGVGRWFKGGSSVPGYVVYLFSGIYRG